MACNSNTLSRKRSGFTIIELLIVVVVIAILAAIATVAYTGIQKNAVSSVMKEVLQQAATKMHEQGILNGSFSQTLPNSIIPPPGVGLALAEVATDQEFCINVTSSQHSDLQWHIGNAQTLDTGVCTGDVIVASIIGDYATPDGNGGPANNAGLAIGDGGGFVITTDADWTGLFISWDPVEGATRYELQIRQSPTDTWRQTKLSSGQGLFTYIGPAYTSDIPPTTTSFDWPNGDAKPNSAGQTYAYRLRSYVGSVAGDWYTASLSPPQSSSIPAPKSLSVAANSTWTGLTVSWSASLAMTPKPKYELQIRQSPTDTWRQTKLSSGQGLFTYIGPAYTSDIPPTTTSFDWPNGDAKPNSAGQTYEYRVRSVSTTIAGLTSPWTTTTLSPPPNDSLPALASLTVTPTGGWTGLDVSWSGDVSAIPSYYYEFQVRTSPTDTWRQTKLSSGQGRFNTTGQEYTSNIPSTTTSFSWPNGDIKPTNTGQTYEYRIRAKSSTISGTYGPWTTTSLSR